MAKGWVSKDCLHAAAFLAVAGEGAFGKESGRGGGGESGGALFGEDHVEVVLLYIILGISI